jgi:putative oxidoreductase
MDTLFTIGQVVLGAYFIFSGLNHFMKAQAMTGYAASKGLPAPSASVLLSGVLLVLGGLGVLFQYQVTYAYGALILFLVVAAVTMHAFWKAGDPMAKMGDMINFQKNIALASALLMLLALQGGV